MENDRRIQTGEQAEPITAEAASRLEQESKWEQAARYWGILADRARKAGESTEDYFSRNSAACTEIHRAIKHGDELRAECQRGIDTINSYPEADKRQLSWQIQGYRLGMLTRSARLEMEEFFNQFPAVPKQTIINWGDEYYNSWHNKTTREDKPGQTNRRYQHLNENE